VHPTARVSTNSQAQPNKAFTFPSCFTSHNFFFSYSTTTDIDVNMATQNKRSKQQQHQSGKYASIIRTRSHHQPQPTQRTPLKDRTLQENSTDDDEILLSPKSLKTDSCAGSKRPRPTATENTPNPETATPTRSPPLKRHRSNSPPHTTTQNLGQNIFLPSLLLQPLPSADLALFEDPALSIPNKFDSNQCNADTNDTAMKPKVRFASSIPS
jgi:hypothetical protein